MDVQMLADVFAFVLIVNADDGKAWFSHLFIFLKAKLWQTCLKFVTGCPVEDECPS